MVQVGVNLTATVHAAPDARVVPTQESAVMANSFAALMASTNRPEATPLRFLMVNTAVDVEPTKTWSKAFEGVMVSGRALPMRAAPAVPPTAHDRRRVGRDALQAGAGRKDTVTVQPAPGASLVPAQLSRLRRNGATSGPSTLTPTVLVGTEPMFLIVKVCVVERGSPTTKSSGNAVEMVSCGPVDRKAERRDRRVTEVDDTVRHDRSGSALVQRPERLPGRRVERGEPLKPM